MNGTRRHGHHRSDHRREAPGGPMYWGWSPESGQMEMMDLRRYVDAVRAGYDRALEDLYGRVSALTGAYGGGMPGMGAVPFPVPGPYGGPPAQGSGSAQGSGHGHGHGHGHGTGHGHGHGRGCCEDDGHGHGKEHHGCGHHDGHGGHGHDSGCGDYDDCRCECCVADADIVVYARCGEVRVVPIEIENGTRKDRENVELEVSRFRSGGGRELPWKAALSQKSPLTIRGCETVKLELVVGIVCERSQAPVEPGKEVKPGREPVKNPSKPAPAAEDSAADRLVRLASDVRDRTGGVDSCTVGYVTVRVGGCLVRPIVVAVAALPDDCGAYEASCSCADCC